MTSMGDLSQLAVADGEFAPLMRALAAAANPANDPRGAGALDRGIQLLGSMTNPEYDRYLVLEAVLPKLVTPIDGGAGRSPLEIAVVALADIHREDASLDTPLSSRDYAFFIETIRKALVDKTRGFEQLYAIVNNQGDGQ